ncbi:MAG: FAD-dependent oxidoreductase [Hymenobacteraceae bacterium]|nr:FAD-dependent oxidoreductase [Hymenobacteraceae bacterium]
MSDSPASAQLSSGATRSAWHGTAVVPHFAPLTTDASADVVIVGAGIAGLTTAYELAVAGRRVIVLDDGPIVSGESGRTTAHLANALDDGFYHLEQLFGEDGARLAAEAHGAAIRRIEEISKTEGIACDFRRLSGYLFVGEGCDENELYKDLEAATRAGLPGVRLQAESGQKGVAWGGPCLVFQQQGQFHIIKYLNGLARAIEARGGHVHGHSHVAEVQGGEAAFVRLSNGAIVRAGHVVVATNVPFNDLVVMHTKQAPYRTYVVAHRVPAGSIAAGLYWDTADPYYYVRLQGTDPAGEFAGDDLLIVGGLDHKTGQPDHDTERKFDELTTWTIAHFADVGPRAYAWSGQVLEPNDALGYAGRNPLDADNVFIITGDSGHGMTHGTLGAMLITDLIQEKENLWADLFDPGRVTLKPAAPKEFARENANVAAEYIELLTGGDVASSDEIKPGTGAVLRRGTSKVAAYRDEAGAVHECSAICPHLGCVVAWNNVEKSWDCPCHGSRFDALGALLAGPANTGLAAVEK